MISQMESISVQYGNLTVANINKLLSSKQLEKVQAANEIIEYAT